MDNQGGLYPELTAPQLLRYTVTLKQKQMVEMTIHSNDHGLQSREVRDLHPDNPLLAVWTSTTYIICESLYFSPSW